MYDRVIVMQDGQVVERGTFKQVYSDLQQAYTRELVATIPRIAMGNG